MRDDTINTYDVCALLHVCLGRQGIVMFIWAAAEAERGVTTGRSRIRARIENVQKISRTSGSAAEAWLLTISYVGCVLSLIPDMLREGGETHRPSTLFCCECSKVAEVRSEIAGGRADDRRPTTGARGATGLGARADLGESNRVPDAAILSGAPLRSLGSNTTVYGASRRSLAFGIA